MVEPTGPTWQRAISIFIEGQKTAAMCLHEKAKGFHNQKRVREAEFKRREATGI